jgi:S1-C subfamily serine protease
MKRILLPLVILLSTFILTTSALNFNSFSNISKMPLVEENDPKLRVIKTAPPVEDRGKNVRMWLQSSFKIKVPGASGSGTLCYYDAKTNTGYIISCGHLWDGKEKATASIVTWYHNKKKLKKPREYKAKVLVYSNREGRDLSLLTFHPDWVPEIYYSIAPKQSVRGKAHSVGCDDGDEVAHYLVEIIGIKKGNLITQYNSPRPGRSGGGLMNDEGYLIGVCWGTSDYSGSGLGYFTPLSAIHKFYKQKGYGFLLNKPLPRMARKIPIRDQNNKQREYPPNYIPLPNMP